MPPRPSASSPITLKTPDKDTAPAHHGFPSPHTRLRRAPAGAVPGIPTGRKYASTAVPSSPSPQRKGGAASLPPTTDPPGPRPRRASAWPARESGPGRSPGRLERVVLRILLALRPMLPDVLAALRDVREDAPPAAVEWEHGELLGLQRLGTFLDPISPSSRRKQKRKTSCHTDEMKVLALLWSRLLRRALDPHDDAADRCAGEVRHRRKLFRRLLLGVLLSAV